MKFIFWSSLCETQVLKLATWTKTVNDAEVDPAGKAREFTGEKLQTLVELVSIQFTMSNV